jgi:hypothetical protein
MVLEILPERSSNAPNGQIQEQNARPNMNVKINKDKSENARSETSGEAKYPQKLGLTP